MIGTSKKENYYRIINREEAVKLAITICTKNDIVLILGKGRDKYMAVGDKYIPYGDIEVIEEYKSVNG